LRPGIGPLLKELHGAYKLAVVTSSARSEIEPALEAGALLAYFDALVCAGKRSGSKPAADPYLAAARLLGSEAASGGGGFPIRNRQWPRRGFEVLAIRLRSKRRNSSGSGWNADSLRRAALRAAGRPLGRASLPASSLPAFSAPAFGNSVACPRNCVNWS